MRWTILAMATAMAIATVLCPVTASAAGEDPSPATAAGTGPTAPEPPGPIVKPNNFTINPLGLIFGGLRINYHRGFGDLVSLGLAGVVVAPIMPFVHFWGVGGEVNLLFWPRRPNTGFFVGPFVQVSRTIPTSRDYLGVTAVIPGVELGWRWLWRNGFNIGLGGGAGWGFAVDHEPCPSGAICEYVGSGFALMLIFDLGYAF